MAAIAVSGLPALTGVSLRLFMLLLQLLALALYFKYPYIAALVGWTNVIFALTKVFPWSEPGVSNFFYQFSFDLLFFVAANAGAALGTIQRKTRRIKIKNSSEV